MLARAELMALIPHQDTMCLLDAVQDWDEKHVRCSSSSHRNSDNPLRRDGRLSALHLAEYGAQATAVHGGLLAREQGRRAPPGFLASLRDLRLKVERIDDIAAELLVEAEMLVQSDSGWVYGFRASATGRELATGRVSVILQAGAA
jgi:predicted hotdog family 3-hydroxylacyl-ACP dehydratase